MHRYAYFSVRFMPLFKSHFHESCSLHYEFACRRQQEKKTANLSILEREIFEKQILIL